MASREKKPLAPSKSKQKANNNSSISAIDNKNKKSKIVFTKRQIEWQRVISAAAVVTGTPLPPKLEASLPRKKGLENLKRKQQNRLASKLRVVKTSIIKAKQKVPIKTGKRISADTKRIIRTKKIKQEKEESAEKAEGKEKEEEEKEREDEKDSATSDTNAKVPVSHADNSDNSGKGIDAGKSAKNNIRTNNKKNKPVAKSTSEPSDQQDQEDQSLKSGTVTKGSPKSNKKATDSPARSIKSQKVSGQKNSNTSKACDAEVKVSKSRKSLLKESEGTSASKSCGTTDTKATKSTPDEKCSIDLTIDEVIASMLSDSDVDECVRDMKDVEKLKKGKKMLIDEKAQNDIEIKKEIDLDEARGISDEDLIGSEQGTPSQTATQIKKKSSNSTVQRSLRNGKLRQLSDSDISIDLENSKKRRRLNSDDPSATDQVSDGNMDSEYCFSEYSNNDNQVAVNANKDDLFIVKDDYISNHLDNVSEVHSELENNNNSERSERIGDVGPILRSKTKTRSMEIDVKSDEVKVEDTKPVVKNDNPEDCKKMSIDALRKERILAKFSADKSKCRRNSFNIDMKKAVNSFQAVGKTDGTSQIDQMIENIKLTIAKSIESKIFDVEKSLVLGKNFEVPKIEEIVAPLSTETQKLGLEESAEEEKPNVAKKEIKTESSENSVPKVADTAKEIEKLVMGDIELMDTQSEKKDENKSESSDVNKTQKDGDANSVNENDTNQSTSSTSEDVVPVKAVVEKQPEDVKKCTNVRKSSRTLGKSSSDSSAESENSKKTNKTKSSPKSTEKKEMLTEEKKECVEPSEDASRNENSFLTELPPKVPESDAEEKTISSQCEDNKAKKPSSICGEMETLESISLEVERLIADNKMSDTTQIDLEKTVVEKVSIESDEASYQKDFATEVTLDTSVTENSIIDSSCQQTSENESSVATDSKSEEKNLLSNNNSHILTVDGCDSNLECPTEDKSSSSVEADFPETKQQSCSKTKLLTVAEVNNGVEKIAKKQEEAVKKQEEITKKQDEAAKKQDEVAKKQEEAAKKQEEVTKKQEETAKKQDEATKKQDEAVKKQDEAIKKQDEAVKKQDEVVKKQDEAAKKQDEEMKKQEEAEEKVKDQEKEVIDEKDECKISVDENKRVLRTRDKQKKMDSKQQTLEKSDIKIEEVSPVEVESNIDSSQRDTSGTREATRSVETNENTEDCIQTEPQIRTRRSREVKKRKEEHQQQPHVQSSPKARRSKKETKKSEQQNKEETLLDNEVAKINENKSNVSNFEKSSQSNSGCRGFSEPSADNNQRNRVNKNTAKATSNRCKSENDIDSMQETHCSERLSHIDSLVNDSTPKQTESNVNIASMDDCKATKSPEMMQKDSDEASTSGESSSSVASAIKIFETPEEIAMKESILGMLGLTPLEKVSEHLSQKKKEQYTGTLKTVIRVQKDKTGDKKRSRSPLKMVLKQGRTEGDGDSLEFYTIQKEFGTSGLGDSSSGAHRKFTTNHRYFCEPKLEERTNTSEQDFCIFIYRVDEDNEEVLPKDRQSLVIPEKSSSFSIHPERLCADVCCYCFGKFGSLDTPMHLAQMKSDDRMKKILNIERHLTKDSCLCDACYRHVDRKAHVSPTNLQTKPQKQHRQLMVSKCSARDCKETAKHNVKRRWLVKIKFCLQNQVDIDWESSQHSSMSFCTSHYPKIEKFLTCALCKRRLAKNQTHLLPATETDELNKRLAQHGVPVPLIPGTFVCKLCRYFTQLQLKYKDIENMSPSTKNFFKNYRKRILHYHNIEVFENEEEEVVSLVSKDKEKDKEKDKDKDKEKTAQKKAKCVQSKSSGSTIKSSELALSSNSSSEKSTPEPSKVEGMNLDGVSVSRVSKSNNATNEESSSSGNSNAATTNVQYLSIESTIEKLKKRKALDAYNYGSTSNVCQNVSDAVEILAMDKEVTLTRLPKRPRTSGGHDITPVVQRLGANPSISVRTLFPGEEDMNLHANIEFGNVREVTPQGWEKCSTMIQYDRDTKLLWQELQRPYGNQSSFLRHLILLEKYYRSGDLVLAPNASRNAINYSTSVQNRLISFEGPEKMDEPIMEPISEYNNPHRMSGGYVQERERAGSSSSALSSSFSKSANISRVLKLNPGVSLIKKPPPSLQRLSLPSTSSYAQNSVVGGSPKRNSKDLKQSLSGSYSGGKVFQLSEPEFKRLQSLKKQKQMLADRQTTSMSGSSSLSSSATSSGSSATATTQYQKAQQSVAQTQFQKHLRMQQEMLSRQSRGDFEPLICDTRALANENSPTQNLLNNLNLPKSIQVTTKPPVPLSIPIMPKIPKSLTVIPQTVSKPTDK